ncbi:MAG: Ig-like domain-containing protein [Deferrisomatales bacterium]|nr:Ig-like domain-containing protein [Deferrisomatales bacterium]
MKQRTTRWGVATVFALAVNLVSGGALHAAPPPAGYYSPAVKGPASMTISGVVTVEGVAATLGVDVAVRDAEGAVCGASGVAAAPEPGSFLIHVYGDDDTTAKKCAADGEPLTFEVYVPGTPDVTYTQASLVFTASPWSGATTLPAPPVFSDRASYAVTIDAANRAPTAIPATLTVAEDTATPGTLTGSDPEDDPLTYAVHTNGTLGTVVVTDPAIGAYTYTPNLNATGEDTFTFVANDGDQDSAPATVTVTITPVNDPPTANPATLTVAEDTVTSGALSGSDPEDDPLTYAVHTNGTLGTAVVTDPDTGAYTYTPNPDATGEDTFTFVANDGELDSLPATVTVTITGANDAPTANPATLTVVEDTPTPGTLTGFDPESAPLTYAVVSNGTKGTAVVDGANTGAYTYTPNPNATGEDTFTFKVNDGALDSTPATVTVTITPVNDAPVLTVTGTTTGEEQALLTLALSATDIDSDPLTFSQSGDPTPGASLTPTGPGAATFSWTPPLGSRDDYSVTFHVADDATPVAGTDSVEVTITVTGPVVTVAVPLRAGWNLISFPVAACFVTPGSLPSSALPSGMTAGLCLEKASIAEAFPLTPASAAIEQVRSFDGNGVHNFDPALDPELNDLTWVAGGFGYLVKVSADCTTSFTGERLAPAATLELATGWNLVGYWGDGARYVTTDPVTAGVPFPAGTPASTQVAQADLLPGLTPVAAKSEDLTGEHVWGTDLDYTGPGYGYWVKLTAPAVLSYGP